MTVGPRVEQGDARSVGPGESLLEEGGVLSVQQAAPPLEVEIAPAESIPQAEVEGELAVVGVEAEIPVPAVAVGHREGVCPSKPWGQKPGKSASLSGASTASLSQVVLASRPMSARMTPL